LGEEGVLAAAPGAARRFALTRPITEIRLPGTVQAVLAARIDRLPDEEKAVLMTAAVIGKRFTAGLLHRVVEVLGAPHGGALALAAILGDLARQELVSPSDDGADDVYAFKHPLDPEVAYRAQLADPRARTHAAVARVLETTHAQQLDEHAAVLAHHWEAAGEVLEAARWHHRAADWIGARDRRESTRHWKTVCALLEPLPVTADSAQLGILARHRRLYNAVYLGQPEDEQHALFTQGRALALAHGGPLQVMLMSMSYGMVRVFAGAVQDGVAHLREAMRVADESGDAKMRYVARATLINPLHFAAQLHEALACSEEALALSGDDPRFGIELLGFSPYGVLLLIRSVLLMRIGDLAGGTRELQRAKAIAQDVGDADAIGTTHVFATILADLSGDTTRVLDEARAAMAIAESQGSPFFRAGATAAMGVAHALVGDWSAGASALEAALAIAAERNTGLQIEPAWLADLAECYLGVGDAARAAEVAARALALSRQRATHIWTIDALLAVVRIRLQAEADAGAEIEALLDEAMALIDATGALSMAPFVAVERAALARRRGDRSAEERLLRDAHARFSTMGATGHARRIGALLV
jgi:adenylate cyclase